MTFFETGSLATPAAFVAAALIGLAFGFWLERAGFGSSRKLAGIFYLRDFAVVQVMFTAVVTALIGLFVLQSAGITTPTSLFTLETTLGPQILGGAIFGAGFVIAGWCPGTALVGAASGKLDAVAFLAAAGVGSLGYAAIYGGLAGFSTFGACGAITLPEVLGVPVGALTAAVAAIALVMFAVIARIERARTTEVIS